jgi:hypothetical protein
MQVWQIASDPLVDLSLVVEMGYREFAIGQGLCTGKRGPDIVLECRRLRGGASEILGLLGLLLAGLTRRATRKEMLPEICHGEDNAGALYSMSFRSVDAGEYLYLESLDERSFVVGVGRDYFCAFRCELLCVVTAWVAGDGTNFPAIELKEGASYTATLCTSSTNDGDGFAHFEVYKLGSICE